MELAGHHPPTGIQGFGVNGKHRACYFAIWGEKGVMAQATLCWPSQASPLIRELLCEGFCRHLPSHIPPNHGHLPPFAPLESLPTMDVSNARSALSGRQGKWQERGKRSKQNKPVKSLHCGCSLTFLPKKASADVDMILIAT